MGVQRGLGGRPALAEAQRGSVFFGWGHSGGFAARPPSRACQMGPQVCWAPEGQAADRSGSHTDSPRERGA